MLRLSTMKTIKRGINHVLNPSRFPMKGNFAIKFIRCTHSETLENLLQEKEERDLVNFPRPERAELPGRVRFGFVPDEWFTFLYHKIGVTGPYTIALGMATFLVSKEIYVFEHNFFNGASMAVTSVAAVKKIGPPLAAYLDKEIEIVERKYKELHLNMVKQYEDAISDEKHEQWRAEGQLILLDAKRKTIATQLEAEYRERVMEAYNKVKQRLEWEVEQQRVIQNLSHKHMVQWIRSEINQFVVSRSFDQKFIKQCIEDLISIAPQVQGKSSGSGSRYQL